MIIIRGAFWVSLALLFAQVDAVRVTVITDTEKVRYLSRGEQKRARAPGEAACRLGQTNKWVYCLTIAEKIQRPSASKETHVHDHEIFGVGYRCRD